MTSQAAKISRLDLQKMSKFVMLKRVISSTYLTFDKVLARVIYCRCWRFCVRQIWRRSDWLVAHNSLRSLSIRRQELSKQTCGTLLSSASTRTSPINHMATHQHRPSRARTMSPQIPRSTINDPGGCKWPRSRVHARRSQDVA
jgi:hypothetical protein